MTDQRPITTLPQSTYTIKEAAALVGKSDITLVRWCRDGVLANASKVPGPKGEEWSIPADDLAEVIESKGLKIDLRDMTNQDRSSDLLVAQSNEEMIDLLRENAELREKTGHLTGQQEQLTRQNERLASDVDHLRAEYERTQAELTESERSRGQLEGQLEQAQSTIRRAEEQHAQTIQERDSLDQKYHELQKRRAESLSTVSADLETAAGERDDLATKLAKAEDSMGWWTRRRYAR